MVSVKSIYLTLLLNAICIGVGLAIFDLMEPIENAADLAWMLAVAGGIGFSVGTLATLLILRIQKAERKSASGADAHLAE